jgi:hypothetical protein
MNPRDQILPQLRRRKHTTTVDQNRTRTDIVAGLLTVAVRRCGVGEAVEAAYNISSEWIAAPTPAPMPPPIPPNIAPSTNAKPVSAPQVSQ